MGGQASYLCRKDCWILEKKKKIKYIFSPSILDIFIESN